MSLEEWTPISSTYISGTLSDNEYKPPSNVMSTAVIPTNDNLPLEFYWDTGDLSQKFYVYMYFAEVEDLKTGELREFNISLNGGLWNGPIVPKKMIPTTILNKFSISASGSLNFIISKTSTSTRPPILNALEIYSVKQFSQSPTSQDEGVFLYSFFHEELKQEKERIESLILKLLKFLVDAIKKIKSVYKLMESSWQGDPCVPRNYSWGGLICSDNGYDAPNIISL